MINIDLIQAKTIVTNAKKSQYYLAFDYVMNIYRGCNHGCIYCYARSNFYEKTTIFDNIRVKENALQIIRDDLKRKIKRGIVLTAGASDPYNSLEKELLLTRNALELINAYDFGICIVTKSDLVLRDTDILTDIREHSPTSVNFTITCSNDELSKKVEPQVSTSSQRFKAIEKLSKNGIITGVLMDPVMPFLTDTKENITEMVKMAKHYGARYIYLSTAVTLADVQRDYFYQKIDEIYPDLSTKYKKRYGFRYRCPSSNSKNLWDIFVQSCINEGITWNIEDANRIIKQGYSDMQLRFI